MRISAVIVESLQHQHVGERKLKLLLKQQRWSLGALPSGVHTPYALWSGLISEPTDVLTAGRLLFQRKARLC